MNNADPVDLAILVHDVKVRVIQFHPSIRKFLNAIKFSSDLSLTLSGSISNVIY